jgi:NAD(P)-dependent dehydrogenase (short-subunit alcohol dehydrogenase family)
MSSADSSPVPDYPSLLRLDGKGFIVLGAGQGMGRQTAHALAQAGARVFCVDLDEQRAREVAQETGGIAFGADCTRRSDVESLVNAAERHLGTIAGFVDIIGMALWGGVLEVDDAAWDRQFDVVLRHAYLVSQLAGRRLRETGGGTMVFIASISGLSGAPGHAAYGAAKAGLMAWVRSLALELGPLGIRANAVAPGSILTPRRAQAYSDERNAQVQRAIPLGRRGNPSEIAAAALFLSSPLSSYLCGQTLVVDGGVTARFPLPI